MTDQGMWLVAGLPLPAKHESLLAELLFSQMLRVPQAQLKPLAYSTLMVCFLFHKGQFVQHCTVNLHASLHGKVTNVACAQVQVDVCKLMATFPTSMSACVRECFARMDVMDPEMRTRLCDWLAYHLSNFEFMWPWDKWKYVLTAPVHDSRRRAFVLIL